MAGRKLEVEFPKRGEGGKRGGPRTVYTTALCDTLETDSFLKNDQFSGCPELLKTDLFHQNGLVLGSSGQPETDPF